MAELRYRLGTLWKRYGRDDIDSGGGGGSGIGLGEGPLGTMALGGA